MMAALLDVVWGLSFDREITKSGFEFLHYFTIQKNVV
jgi:hypothetical protein